MLHFDLSFVVLSKKVLTTFISNKHLIFISQSNEGKTSLKSINQFINLRNKVLKLLVKQLHYQHMINSQNILVVVQR